MYESDTFSTLSEEYRASCQRFEDLANTVSHDNNSALVVFEQCEIGLKNSKEQIEHYLHELKHAGRDEKTYYLHTAREALVHFNELLVDAEIKLRDVRPIPPFLY